LLRDGSGGRKRPVAMKAKKAKKGKREIA